jgi:hypothetical protein
MLRCVKLYSLPGVPLRSTNLGRCVLDGDRARVCRKNAGVCSARPPGGRGGRQTAAEIDPALSIHPPRTPGRPAAQQLLPPQVDTHTMQCSRSGEPSGPRTGQGGRDAPPDAGECEMRPPHPTPRGMQGTPDRAGGKPQHSSRLEDPLDGARPAASGQQQGGEAQPAGGRPPAGRLDLCASALRLPPKLNLKPHQPRRCWPPWLCSWLAAGPPVFSSPSSSNQGCPAGWTTAREPTPPPTAPPTPPPPPRPARSQQAAGTCCSCSSAWCAPPRCWPPSASWARRQRMPSPAAACSYSSRPRSWSSTSPAAEPAAAQAPAPAAAAAPRNRVQTATTRRPPPPAAGRRWMPSSPGREPAPAPRHGRRRRPPPATMRMRMRRPAGCLTCPQMQRTACCRRSAR